MIAAAPVEILCAAPGRAPGDDTFGISYARGALHAWVIDGATSVSEGPGWMVPGFSDPGWFARALSQEIRGLLRFLEVTDGALGRVLDGLRDRFAARAGAMAADHDWPVAAMSYLRIAPNRGGFDVETLDFADCFHAVQRGGTGPAPLGALPGPLTGTSLPKTGEMIERMRLRRAAQVRDLSSSAITLDARSTAKGVRRRFWARAGDEVFLGSDGYARLWEEYGIYTRDQALGETVRSGAARMLGRLRAFERCNPGHGAAPKGADDVTLLRIRLGVPPMRGDVRTSAGGLLWRASPHGRVRAEGLRA